MASVINTAEGLIRRQQRLEKASLLIHKKENSTIPFLNTKVKVAKALDTVTFSHFFEPKATKQLSLKKQELNRQSDELHLRAYESHLRYYA